jgi:hypothetical protein
MSDATRPRTATFQILDAVVANGPVVPGSACPSPKKQAIGRTTHTIVICGRNRANVVLTPTAAQWSPGGDPVAHM